MNSLERRIIEVLAPFSLELRCVETHDHGFDFHVIEAGTRVDLDALQTIVSFMPREIWRDTNNPVVQIALPHIFLSDETLHLSQVPAWASADSVKLPGMLISGRFPAHLWPRPLNLAFEWTDKSQSFKMKRGQPICYLMMELESPERTVELIEGRMTENLRSYLSKISDVVKFTSQSFDLFDRAKEIRPKKLLEAM